MKESLIIKFLYKTVVGRAILKFLVNLSISRASARFLSSSFSKWLVPVFVRRNFPYKYAFCGKGDSDGNRRSFSRENIKS